MNPTYSVIMPLYNKAPYVRKALESVLLQTYTDFELIIVDDGSTDNSYTIVSQTCNQKSKITNNHAIRLIHQPNAGVSAARNNGVAASKGEYVCFLDADDWWEPTFLEEIDRLIKEYPDAGLYAANYVYYKPGKTHVALNLPRGYINYPEAYYQSGAMPIWTGATSMRRKVFDEMGGFPLDVRLGEDFLLWAKTALHYQIAFSDQPMAYYNNDVPASLRATRNLHAPQYHMLFLLEPLETEIATRNEKTQADWKRLIDKLRVGGLLEYWMDDRYRDMARAELAKVDWSQQSASVIRIYNSPIWFLRAKRRFLQVGSYVKQKLIRMRK